MQVLLATGKPPGGAWIERVFPKIGPWPQAGVFLQGTVVRGEGGTTISTRDLGKEIIAAVIAFGKKHSESLAPKTLAGLESTQPASLPKCLEHQTEH